ncbi:hypothetical protein [Mucilaginibacter sp.]|uniref:hypothetical protein n=1 Tax=Mucilaginibacter sp. TaxID=1882438 RepID=UPI00261A55BF|nr:hypothetical protein [Mucilaginibacter sp.]MDB4923390.1 hypothetical protein [Mucilaginibacter sp.]
MKYINLLCVASLLIASCSSDNSKSANKDSIDVHAADTAKISAAAASPLCFLRTEGKSNRDSTSIELIIENNKVTGRMIWLPYQKDSRKGAIEGTIKGDTINAVWSFMQEGMKDTLNLKFKLSNNELLQKPLKQNVKTGREQTDESVGYTLNYPASNKVQR